MLTGVWENEYGSRLTVRVVGDKIAGEYHSTTGSTGRYLISGWCGAASLTPGSGRPIALAISWRSIAPGDRDDSRRFASLFGGQLINADGRPALVLNHLLVAPVPLAGLCESGVYADKLMYRRVGDAPPPDDADLLTSPRSDQSIAGVWRADDGAMLDLWTGTDVRHGTGVISGSLALGGLRRQVAGFFDCQDPAEACERQSVAIAALDKGGATPLGLAGWLNRDGDTMDLHMAASRRTDFGSIYLQTALSFLRFRRDGADKQIR